MHVDDHPVQVLCAGILVADLFVPPMASLPEEGELQATEDFLLSTGGCAANVAVSLAQLGVDSTVVGRVGSDVFGEFIVNDLAAKQVGTSYIQRSAATGTSKTVVLPVVGQDRRFIHTFGANGEFSGEGIPLDVICDGGVLYLGGFLIMPALRPEVVGELFRNARNRGITTILDVVVPAGEGSSCMDQLQQILPFADYFLPNDEEAHALTGHSEPAVQAEQFLSAGCRNVLITQGSEGTLLMSDTIQIEVESYPIDYVDGSGSGDAFAAGFIAGLVNRWDLVDTMKFASAVGASACTKLGCTAGVLTCSETELFVRKHPLMVAVHAR